MPANLQEGEKFMGNKIEVKQHFSRLMMMSICILYFFGALNIHIPNAKVCATSDGSSHPYKGWVD
jgi:hypothetical protein